MPRSFRVRKSYMPCESFCACFLVNALFSDSKRELRPGFAELAFGGGNHHGGILAGQRLDFKGNIAARRTVRLEVADLEKHTEELDNFRHVVCAAGIAEAWVLIAPRGIVAVFETGIADVDVRDVLPHGQQRLRRRFAEKWNVAQ